jgi:hypothetical protein
LVFPYFEQERPAADVEVGSGNFERAAIVLGQEIVEDNGHFVLLIVDDEWDGQGLAPM